MSPPYFRHSECNETQQSK